MAPNPIAGPQTHDARRQRRYAVQGAVPFRLETTSGQTLAFVYVDVSCRGLGIFLLASQLQRHDELRLRLDEGKEVAMKVCWIRSDLVTVGLPQYVRAGLCALDPEVDLLALFQASGCVES